MRLFSWYWSLTKKVNFRNFTEMPGGFFRFFWLRLVWYLITVPLLAIAFSLAIWLWISLPSQARELVFSTAGFIWAFIKPFFDWVSSIDFAYIGDRIDSFFHLFARLTLHFAVGVFTASFVFVLLLLILDFIRATIFKYDLDREKKTAIIFFVIMALFVGYSVTTSDRSVSAISHFTSWTVNH